MISLFRLTTTKILLLIHMKPSTTMIQFRDGTNLSKTEYKLVFSTIRRSKKG